MVFEIEAREIGTRRQVWVIERRIASEARPVIYVDHFRARIEDGRAIVQWVNCRKDGKDATFLGCKSLGTANEIVPHLAVRVAALLTTSPEWMTLAAEEVGIAEFMRWTAAFEEGEVA